VTLTVYDGLSIATATATVTVAAPALTMPSVTAGTFTLSWPAWAAGCNLYSATNLAPPAAWVWVTNAVTSSNGVLSVTLPISSGNRFFQLRSP